MNSKEDVAMNENKTEIVRCITDSYEKVEFINIENIIHIIKEKKGAN